MKRATSAQEQDFEPQIVTVSMQGSSPAYLLGNQVLRSREQLAIIISKLPRDPGIIIRVKDDVPVGFAVAAIQESRNAGFERVTYVPASD